MLASNGHKRAILVVFAPLILAGIAGCDFLSSDTVHEEKLSDGSVLKVTRVASGPTGPGEAFELSHMSDGMTEAAVIAAWEQPPGESDIDVYELQRSVVVLTPPRDTLHVRNATGRWQNWPLREIVKNAAEQHSSLLIPARHEPATTVAKFETTTNVATVHVRLAGWPVQTLEIQLADAGNELTVLSAENPDDPRQAYLRSLSLPADAEILTIAKELSGDGYTDVLVSHDGAVNGRAGNIWTIFLATGEAFKRLDRYPSIRVDAVSSWVPSQPAAANAWSTTGISTYHPGSSTSGMFITYYVDDFELKAVATEYTDTGSEESEYDRIFRSELVVPVSRTRFSTEGVD